MNVATYLKIRLEQLGLGTMYGVAGNYTAAFLDTILADPNSPITISRNSNEICAGFAADAYARYQGIGAVYVTYSVGAFTALNTIAGSFVEQVPVILINGAPTNKEASLEEHAGLLYSHTTGNQFVDIHMFQPITVAAEKITNAAQSIYQIDSALTAMLTHSRPVYLEVAEDVWRAECRAPEGMLAADLPGSVTQSEVEEAVAATIELVKESSKALFWAGMELERYQLQDQFENLLETVNQKHAAEPIHFITTALGKGVISEENPYFDGCVTLKRAKIESLLGDDGILIGLGGWTIGKDTGNEDIHGPRTVLASHGGVSVGARYYPSVDLGSFMTRLQEELLILAEQKLQNLSIAPPVPLLASTTQELGYDSFFHTIEPWLGRDKILTVDAGFPLIGAQSVQIKERGGFLCQAAWLSIGYSVAAATGAKAANPDKRVAVVVGDGAFHETCQAIADHTADRQNTVVFVLSNGIYGIEQFIVNPNPFRTPADKTDYPDQNLNSVYQYNEIPRWDFVKIAEGFGAQGRKVETVDNLQKVLEEVDQTPEANFVIEIVIPKTDIPSALNQDAKTHVGEDEYQNPNWPPYGKF